MYARLRCGGNLPLPRPGVDRPLRGNCHPLSCAPDNQVRCVFGSMRCKKQASTVRKGHSVHENPLFLHGRRFLRHSVLRTGFYGTEEIFGTGNALLWYATHLQRCAKRHPVTPNASSKARRTADSTDCGQPHAAPDASSVRETAPARR